MEYKILKLVDLSYYFYNKYESKKEDININNNIINNKKNYNIINQLELENINITKIMFDELSQILNSNKSYINEYIILKEKDLYNEKKINFYFILLKYILKNSIYI